MDEASAQSLVDLTRDFYAGNAASFSETRQAPWSGWDRVLEEAGVVRDNFGDAMRIADIGCGNLRFEKMLVEGLEGACRADARPTTLHITCVDGNAAFLEEAVGLRACAGERAVIETMRADIVESIVADGAGVLSRIKGCDLVVCFALMHHIPMATWRQALLDALVDMAAPGGCIAVSFWCFSRDDRLLGKAHEATDAIEERFGLHLDRAAGDYVMGWRDAQDSWRYCHDFAGDDITVMIESRIRRCGDIVEVARFAADGRGGDLNEYVILKKR